MPRTAKNPKLNTLEARSLYMVGDHTGIRITDPKEIARRTGCHETTVRGYIKKEWQKEREEMLKSVHDGSLAIELNERTAANHRLDETFLRQRLDELKIEASNVQEIEDQLFTILDSVDSIAEFPPKLYETLAKLIEKYLDTCASKRAITAQFMQVKKAWDNASGLDARLKAGETALKAIATVQARAEAEDAIEKRRAESRRDVTPEGSDPGLSVFNQD